MENAHGSERTIHRAPTRSGNARVTLMVKRLKMEQGVEVEKSNKQRVAPVVVPGKAPVAAPSSTSGFKEAVPLRRPPMKVAPLAGSKAAAHIAAKREDVQAQVDDHTIQLHINNVPMRFRRVQTAMDKKPPAFAMNEESKKTKAPKTVIPKKKEMKKESSVKRTAPAEVVAEEGKSRRQGRAIDYRRSLRCQKVWRARTGGVYIDANMVDSSSDDEDATEKKQEGSVGAKRSREAYVYDVYEVVDEVNDEHYHDASDDDVAVEGDGPLKNFSDDDEDEQWWRENGTGMDTKSTSRKAVDSVRGLGSLFGGLSLSNNNGSDEAWVLLGLDDEDLDELFDIDDDDDNADEQDYAHDHRFDDEYDSNAEDNAMIDYPQDDDEDDEFGGNIPGTSNAFAAAANPFAQYGDDHEAEAMANDGDMQHATQLPSESVPAGRSRTQRVKFADPNDGMGDYLHEGVDDASDEDDGLEGNLYADGEGDMTGYDFEDDDDCYGGQQARRWNPSSYGDDDSDGDTDAFWNRKVRQADMRARAYEEEHFGAEEDDPRAHVRRQLRDGVVVQHNGHRYADVEDDNGEPTTDGGPGGGIYSAMARHEAQYDDDEMNSFAADDDEAFIPEEFREGYRPM